MRTTVTALIFIAFAETAAAECITVSINVRQADVVAVARYAGERTFTVESILRAVVPPPSKIIAPEDWRPSQCAPPEPLAGQTYVVALNRNGSVHYRDWEKTAAERALIERLHRVDSSAILAVLERYADGEMTAGETEDWLSTAVVDTRSQYSFARELLEATEWLVTGMRQAEGCHEKAVGTIRLNLAKAVRVLERSVPPVDTEEEFIRRYTEGIQDPLRRGAVEDDAVEAFDEIAGTIRVELDPLEKGVRALPWCDPKAAVRRGAAP